MTVGVTVDGLWKRFHRGQLHDSLRDLIPAAITRTLGRRPRPDQLGRDDFWALRDVSFTVEGGEALGIIGKNGAGKSTLLKILSGILRPNRGTARICGRVRALIEIAAGFHPDLTGRENVFLNGAILGLRRREVAAKLDSIVDFAGIGEFLDTPVKRYSSGMYARLGFAVAAHMEPEVLLVDEILAVGDLAFQRKCYDYMTSLTHEGVAVVLVSHNMGAIAQICGRTLVLSRGEVHHLGPTAASERAYVSLLASVGREAGVTLEGVRVTDETGRDKRTFRAGERCRLQARLRTEVAHERVALGVSVLDSVGHDVFHTDTERLGRHEIALHPGKLTAISVQLTLNLGGGTYTVQFSGHYHGPPSPHEVRQRYFGKELFRLNATEVEVLSDPAASGIAFLEPVIRCDAE